MGDPDEHLMLRVGRGDGEACRALVERHLGRVVALAARVLGSAAEAEDVAQEVFTRVWTSAGSWRPGAARFTTWLHRVALNLCLDRLARRREAPLESAPEPVDPGPTPAARLEEAEVRQRVGREIAALPERQRVALALCHYEGLRNIEAAEIMGVTVEALESLLARARRTLRVRLEETASELLGEREWSATR
jgi:RNA polymerase sigma-70 factor (ECF subfamily)